MNKNAQKKVKKWKCFKIIALRKTIIKKDHTDKKKGVINRNVHASSESQLFSWENLLSSIIPFLSRIICEEKQRKKKQTEMINHEKDI